MAASARIRRALRGAVIPALALAALFGATTAQAAPVAESGPIGALAGSGTVNDPWVPMRNARTTCQSTTLFGNYTPGSGHASPITVLPANTWLGVRYITSDGNSADVLWHDGDKWGFLLRSCFTFTD
mgnify:CR=1 FL=1